jgi:hypothetical protein
MQPLESLFRERFSNFAPPEASPSLFQFSFILDARCTQPILIYRVPTQAPRLPPRPGNVEAELADYVEKMAGTAFDLDPELEAASIEHILSAQSDDE